MAVWCGIRQTHHLTWAWTIPGLARHLHAHRLPGAVRPQQGLSGYDRSSKSFRAAAAREYPADLCKAMSMHHLLRSSNVCCVAPRSLCNGLNFRLVHALGLMRWPVRAVRSRPPLFCPITNLIHPNPTWFALVYHLSCWLCSPHHISNFWTFGILCACPHSFRTSSG